MSVNKVVLLFTYWEKKSFSESFSGFLIKKNWVWKSKNVLFGWLGALSFCQIWKNLLVPMNGDPKDYLILGASLGNVFPWITIIRTVILYIFVKLIIQINIHVATWLGFFLFYELRLNTLSKTVFVKTVKLKFFMIAVNTSFILERLLII